MCSESDVAFTDRALDTTSGWVRAPAIISAWAEEAKAGLLDSAFFAEMVLRAVPSLLSLPLDALEAQCKIPDIIIKLVHKLRDDVQLGMDHTKVLGSGYNSLMP